MKPQAAEKECPSSAQPPFLNTVGAVNYKQYLQRASKKGVFTAKSSSTMVSSNDRNKETRATDNGRMKKHMYCNFFLYIENMYDYVRFTEDSH